MQQNKKHLNRYEKRMQAEAEERQKRKLKMKEWEQQNEKYQEEMRDVKKYTMDIDGVPMGFVNDGSVVQEGNVIVIQDGYGEYNVLTVKTIKSGESLEGKRIKYTLPAEKETENVYEMNGEHYTFDTKLSKNQIVLLNGTLYTVKEIDKETKQVEIEKRESKKMTALYGVYTQTREQGKLLHSVYEKWGDAYGVVLKKRFSGHKEFLL